ncbi:MAG TPA: N-acetyl-alpha-D-glucosaminyl L-malate synthase BshA [Candidatus Krumholzibacteria bacterium]|nr:N-acetyl-alpha-D-glucosaminyl L-malate synthase BshA [Candidatus Krumholzibacteria bacterium]
MTRLRIGMVCYPTLGGSGVVATELGKSLARLGSEVHFITTSHPARLSAYDEHVYFHKVVSEEYPLFQNYTPYSLSLSVKIREVAEQYSLDLVHVHYAIPHAASAFLAREMLKPRRLPTMTTLHGTDITLVGMMPSYYEITRFSIEKSDAVTAVSEFLRLETIKEFRIEHPIEVIHNFVDTQMFRPNPAPAARRRLAPAGEKILMHVSNFRKVKNLPVLLQVFYEVQRLMPCRLVLVGDGPERESTERHAEALGVAGSVVFLGDQEYIADLLPAADVFVLPSQHESFGLAALEAMSCGVPVVGSRIGGLPEVIEHEKTGFLCDPNDVECMKAIVLGLLKNDALRREIGAAARERAERLFNRDRIVAQYMSGYERLLGG